MWWLLPAAKRGFSDKDQEKHSSMSINLSISRLFDGHIYIDQDNNCSYLLRPRAHPVMDQMCGTRHEFPVWSGIKFTRKVFTLLLSWKSCYRCTVGASCTVVWMYSTLGPQLDEAVDTSPTHSITHNIFQQYELKGPFFERLEIFHRFLSTK